MNLAPFVPALGVTFQIAVGSWILAVVVGLVIAMLRELKVPFIAPVLAGVVDFLRSVPELVLLYVVFFGLAYIGLALGSVPAAIVALGVSEGAFVSEYFRGAILTVTDRQRAAATSLGMSTAQTFRLIVLPQAIPFSIPPLVNAFVGVLKTATLAVAVGAPELLYVAREQMALTGDILQISALLVAIYVVITIPLTLAASKMEVRARKRLAT